MRGEQELLYAGMRISGVFRGDTGLGVLLVWRRQPLWATEFVEMVLVLSAGHAQAP